MKVKEHVGLAFVSILFGIVVGLMVADLADEIRGWIYSATDVRISRVTHLLVGVFLTVLSFLGYFASQNRPKHRIYFFNLPLALFLLDVLMVFDYYVVLGFTESAFGAEIFTRTDARPEAILVAAAFFLYFLWDIVGWKISSDAEYQETIDAPIDKQFGARRWVTFAFLILFMFIAIIIWQWNPSSEVCVALLDGLLIAILIAYRITKPLFDPTVTTRRS